LKTPVPSPFHDLVAFIVVVVACPIAVFGGANLGCVGSTAFSGACAATMIFVSPLVLLVGGVIAGVATEGWTGLLVVLIGTLVGMFTILLLAQFAGNPVPVDWFSAVVASIFFGGPIVIGYGIGRIVARLLATRRA